MRAILVCVEFSDLLSITLPYNRHHFEDVMVVTHTEDIETIDVASKNECRVFETDAFYRNGADFNKWLALEEGLDAFGRRGVMCLMDADVMWPKSVSLNVEVGKLYTPYRHLFEDVTAGVPEEKDWPSVFLHKHERDFAGYTQIFHAEDPVLGEPPWHQTNWRHAGGADTFFQEKWATINKVRPGFNVLHIGPTDSNWCGRTTNLVNGSVPELAEKRKDKLKSFLNGRQKNRGRDKFSHEKIAGSAT